jgi:BirA family biotin operon repressor/biotin-[acetyl-CoA-carboxylase] ligase
LAGRGFPLRFAGSGQVLLGPDTPLHEEELRRTLRTRVIGRKVAVHGSVTSTQDVAREAVARAGEAGLVVVAEEQRAGRGRLGRRWLSPVGKNLLFSTVLFPPKGLGTALVATSAVAVAEAVGEAYGLDAGIRWPNDVLVSERKVAGILVEAVTRGTGEEGFAVGVGVNVNASPEGVSRAGALAELVGRELDRTPLLVRLLEALDRWYDVLLRGHLEEVEVHWRARSSILGRQVTLEREGERYRGRVVDLSVTEGIILELAPGLTRLFPTEHVSLVTEPSG